MEVFYEEELIKILNYWSEIKVKLETTVNLERISTTVGGIILLKYAIEILVYKANITIHIIPKYLSTTISYLISYSFLFIFIYFIFKIRAREAFYQHEKNLTGIKASLSLSLLLISISTFFSISFNYFSGIGNILSTVSANRVEEINSFRMDTLLAGCMAAMFEEMLYRGIVLQRLKNHGNVFAIIVSAVLFGFMHGIRFIDTFVVGIMLGSVYVITGNLIYPIFMHFYVNVILAIIGYITLFLFPAMSNIQFIFIRLGILMIIILTTYVICKSLNVFDRLHIRSKFIYIKFLIKNEKSKYKTFFYSPTIVILIIREIWIIFNGIGVLLVNI